MTCNEFRKLVLTTRSADRSRADREQLASHRLECAECGQLWEKMSAMQSVLDAQPSLSAPDDLSTGIMTEVRAMDAPKPATWYTRLLRNLQMPVPDLSWAGYAAAAVIAVMLIGSGILVGEHLATIDDGSAYQTTRPATVARRTMTQAQDSKVQAQEEYLQELVQRHRTATLSEPLSDEDGMHLVQY